MAVRTRRTGRLLLALALLLLVIVVIVWRAWPGGSKSPESEHAVAGPTTPSFASAAQLIAAAQRRGVACSGSRHFDPLGHVPSDAVRYPAPDALTCVLPGGTRVYVLVYKRPEDRMKAFDTGDVNQVLCGTPDSHGSTGWPAMVAANWRIATPGDASAMAPLVRAFDDLPAAETISCLFRD
jgi:hypothetical protein